MTPEEFELATAELLRLSGYQLVQHQRLVGSKHVDVYAEIEFPGLGRKRVGVECRRYAEPLTHTETNEIFTDYLALQSTNLIDETLIVTASGLTAQATAYVAAQRNLQHKSFAELQRSILDFGAYLDHLQDAARAHGLQSYFVEPRTGSRELRAVIAEWIETGTDPLAILGGYGMGKTSLVTVVAAELARRAAIDPTARIPIVVPLIDIASQQDLEGLLGRVFTGTGLIRNFSFPAFMRLNESGRLVVFFDGFDEMKHLLTRAQLRYNFRQINRVTKGSRVVITGRPTFFLSRAERELALRGMVVLAGEEIAADPEWPRYRDVELEPFSPAQIEVFLAGYLRYLRERGVPGYEKMVPAEIADRIRRLDERRLSDLATRPLQIRMIADVLPQWKRPIEELSRHELYSRFIDRIIEREQEKLTRSMFGTDTRRVFARDLAFWLWKGRRVGVAADKIPEALFPSADSHDGDVSALRRHMLAAAFVETRASDDVVYFPHVTFQEFLIAEKIVSDLPRRALTFAEASEAAEPAVAEFIAAEVSEDAWTRLDVYLQSHEGGVGEELLAGWIGHRGYRAGVLGRTARNEPWDSVLIAIAVARGIAPEISASEAADRMIEASADSPDPLLLAGSVMRLASAAPNDAGEIVWRLLAALRARGDAVAAFLAGVRVWSNGTVVILDFGIALPALLARAETQRHVIDWKLDDVADPPKFAKTFELSAGIARLRGPFSGTALDCLR